MSYNTRSGMRYYRPMNYNQNDNYKRPPYMSGGPGKPGMMGSGPPRGGHSNHGGPRLSSNQPTGNPPQLKPQQPPQQQNQQPVQQQNQQPPQQQNQQPPQQQSQQSKDYTQPAYSTQPGYVPPQQQSQQTPQPQEPAQKQQPPPIKPAIVQQAPTPPVQSQAPQNQAGTPADIDVQIESDKDDVPSDSSPEKRQAGHRGWHKKGMPFMRVSKKIRKRRQNARLRHILAPKNAMMVLHELYPELKIIATEQLNAANQTVYTVDIEIEGKTYRGHGMSKLAAKQAGCENALKSVLLEKMAKSNVKVNPEEENTTPTPGEVKVENEEPVMMQVDVPEGEGERPPGPRRQYPEDDVPWGSLASFALYKLFSEWQSQGFQLPATNSATPPPIVLQKMPGFCMAPMKKIPDDANQKHPVQLLNQLRPGSQYSETREGTPPNLTFTFSVVVDEQTYQGVGTSKKDAKKECAKAALRAMGVKYD